MGTEARRAKTRTRRVEPASGKAKVIERQVAADPTEMLEEIFAGLPEVTPANGGVPDIVRKNRRERAKRRLRDALEARGVQYPATEALRGELRILAERWAQKGFDDAYSEADDFEIRCADERAVLDAAARGDEEERFAAAERAYLREVEKNYGRIEIRGLQLSERVHQDLEIAYVPLHVEDPAAVSPRRVPRKKKTEKKGKSKAKELDVEAMTAMVRSLERPRVRAMDALAKHPRLLLVGEPGSGKSTLLAYIATRAARGEFGAELGLSTELLPFLVPVRSLHAASVSLEELARVAGAEVWLFKAALERGRALFLIDGLDEARPEVSKEVLDSITAMLDTYPGTRALVTTRPSGTMGEGKPAPAGFAQVKLAPMTREEVGTFVERWCLAAELSLRKTRTQAEADAQTAAEDLKERVGASRAIEKLAQTPLLCSVVCVVHRFLGQRIPERRVALYEAITNVMLYEWDRAKFPEGAATGKLDAHAKRALLARLARKMHEARVAELPANEVIKTFAAHLPALGRPAEEATAIVTEIRDRNGVLVERGPGSFAFSHLTFQEYLAAMELVNARKYDFLIGNYKDKWWHEVTVLAAGFPGADAKRIVQNLLNKDGDDVAEGTMLAAQCVDTAVELPAALRSEIEERVAKLIPPKSIADLSQILSFGELAGPVLVKSIAAADANGKVAIVTTLAGLSYEPSIASIIKLMNDPSEVTMFFGSRQEGVSVARRATAALFAMGKRSQPAFDACMDEGLRTPLISNYSLSQLRITIAEHRAKYGFSDVPLPRRVAHSG